MAAETVRLVEAGEGAAWCRIPESVLTLPDWKEGDGVEVVATTAGIVIRKVKEAINRRREHDGT